MLGTLLGNVDVITLGIYVGTEMVSLVGSFDGSNDNNFEVLLIGGTLGFTYSKVLGSDEAIELVYTDGKVPGNILVNI